MFLEIFQIVFVIVFAVILHEYAHGWVAYKLGDPTAKVLGRLTLNPLKHIDPFGSIVVPVFLKLIGAPMIAWAKPVPINFYGLRNPKKDMIWVAAAGPLTNLTLAGALSILLKFNMPFFLYETINLAVILNLVLGVFNLVPVPPLDGSRIVMGLLPDSLARQYYKLERYGMLIVFALLYFGLFRFVWFLVILLGYYLGVDFSALGFK